jgi:hypothetical protein
MRYSSRLQEFSASVSKKNQEWKAVTVVRRDEEAKLPRQETILTLPMTFGWKSSAFFF